MNDKTGRQFFAEIGVWQTDRRQLDDIGIEVGMLKHPGGHRRYSAPPGYGANLGGGLDNGFSTSGYNGSDEGSNASGYGKGIAR